MRSLNKGEILSAKKQATSSNNKDNNNVANGGRQSHSNSAILRKSNAALKPNGPSPGYQIFSDRDGMVLLSGGV